MWSADNSVFDMHTKIKRCVTSHPKIVHVWITLFITTSDPCVIITDL